MVCKTFVEELPEESFAESGLEGYSLAETRSEYGGVPQRWIVVHSAKRQKAQNKRLQKNLVKLDRELERRLDHLGRETFNCQADARKALDVFEGELGRYHHLTGSELIAVRSYPGPGRPRQSQEPEVVGYRIEAELSREREAITASRRRAGRFILATNVLDEQRLNKETLLAEYRAQNSVERGFRLLKDPMFFTSSVFVKTPERVAAIAMVMGLCLLVYALGERSLRTALQEAGASIRHQSGKPTRRPTLRWVFQLFQAVHLLSVDGQSERISGLTEERKHLLLFLPPGCRRAYSLC
jgi:transposase